MAYETHVFNNDDILYASDMNNIITGIDALNVKVNSLEQGVIGTEIFSEVATREDKTQNGVTFTWNGNVCFVNGTASGYAFTNMILMEPLEAPLVPGKTYYLKLNKTDENIIVTIFQTINGTAQQSQITQDGTFTYDENATRTVIRVEVLQGKTANGTIQPELYLAHSSISNNSSNKRKVKILLVGNSFTLNSVPYVPYIMKNLAESEVDLTIGTAYYSGCSIDKYIEFFDNKTASIRYDKNKGYATNWTRTTGLTLQKILADEDWDMITFQQASMDQENWDTYSNLNGLISRVLSYKMTVHQKPVKFGWLMPQLRLTIKTDESFNNIINCVNNLLNTTPIDFIIPCCTAVENARGTSLNSIGSYASHGLTNDGAHLESGLPVLLTSYVSTLSILKLIGIENHGILGERTRPTADWYNAHYNPSNNGSSVGVTEENCILAQKCAIFAMKKPLEISTNIE